MSLVEIDVDDGLVADAARLLGTKTVEETVNAALLVVIRQARQRTRLDRAAREGTDESLPDEDGAWI